MPESSGDTLARIGDAAARLVRERLGPGAELGELRLIKDVTRAVIARADVGGQAAAPRSVIVKAIRDDPATGFSEWASLAFLTGLPAAAGLAPGFLGGDVAQRVCVMEDLGPGRTLHEVLAEGSQAEAEAALDGLAQQTARLQAVTAGREAAFLQARQGLPAAELTGRRREAAVWRAGCGRLDAWLEAVGAALPPGLAECLDVIAAAYAEPEDWLSFSHGDPAPSNNHIAGPTVRLVDFEYGAFRHALYDITAWNTLCPLPRRYVRRMRDSFRRTLAEAIPAARDEAAFGGAWATLCAYRGLALLTWVSPAVLAADRPMVGDWTARDAVMAAAARTAEATAGVPGLEPAAGLAADLHAALRARWPQLGAADHATRWAALGGDAPSTVSGGPGASATRGRR